MSVDPQDVRLSPRRSEHVDAVLRTLAAKGSIEPRSLWADMPDGTRYSVIVAREPVPSAMPDYRWHVSVAGEDDVPPWRDLVAIGHRIRPGVPLVVGVPPRSMWMSVHEHCLHLWETKDHALVEEWRANATGAVPS